MNTTLSVSFYFQRGGPKGKAQALFEEVSKLPRHQQKHILGTVEIMLAGQRAKASWFFRGWGAWGVAWPD